MVYTDGSSEKQSLNIMGDAGNVIACERDTDSGKAYYYYNKDIRGSTTSILDGSGNCQAAYEYSDFGETAVNSDFYNEIAYTGGIWDQSTGLYYLNARYYDPDDGRFLTEDTVRPEAEDSLTWHLYAYCANNPVNYVDPSGHKQTAIGYGVQIDFSSGKGYTAVNAGFQAIYLNKKIKRYRNKGVHIYFYQGVSNDMTKAGTAVERLLSKPSTLMSKISLSKTVKRLLGGLSASAVFFVLFANTKKINTYQKIAGYGYNVTLKINRVTLALGLNSGAFSVGVGFSTSSGGISFGPAKASFSKKYTNKYRNFTSTVLGKMKASAEKGKTRIRKTYDLNGAK